MTEDTSPPLATSFRVVECAPRVPFGAILGVVETFGRKALEDYGHRVANGEDGNNPHVYLCLLELIRYLSPAELHRLRRRFGHDAVDVGERVSALAIRCSLRQGST